MNLVNIKLAKGLLRLYFVLWFGFALFFCLSSYKELLTFAGVKYWTSEGYEERRKKELNDGRCSDLNYQKTDKYKFSLDSLECPSQTFFSTPLEIAEMKDRSLETWEYFKVMVLYIPMFLLIFLIGLWYAFKWVLQGFRK